MGFFKALSRIVKGEPVFQPGDGKSDASPPQNMVQPLSAPPAPLSPKTLPHITVEDCESHADGTHMACEAEIKNESDVQLDIDLVRMLGLSRDMGTFLRPGEARKFYIYQGPLPKSTADNRCTITFRTHPGGDHFTADFLLEFKKVPNGNAYTVVRLRGLAIRDT